MQKWIDISFWQGDINWPMLAKEVDGVCIKACEGSWVDTRFQEYRKAARKVGLRVQYYAFYRPWIMGAKQAQLYWDLIKNDPGDLPPVLDLEAGVPEANPATVSSSMQKMAMDMTTLSGKVPWIYTAKWFVDRLLTGCWLPKWKEQRVGWMRNYPLFMAMYPWEKRKDFVQNFLTYKALAENPTSKPAPCFPWTSLTAWQWTGHGRVGGTRGDVDMDLYYIGG
jgi:GH25 family lysozyme M1 (1,4-beta-N-acetylmuramidase)